MADKPKVPKLNISRRGFLGVLGGGIAAALTGGIKTAPKVAAVVPEITAQGMPSWFPMLVNKIKTQGKQANTATGGRNSTNTYNLDDGKGNVYMLEEDVVTGNMQVFTRGDDSQQVNFEYLPPTRNKRPDGKEFVEESEFYASEFQKGELQDFENAAESIDDLKFGINSIEEFATQGNKSTKEQLEELVSDFKKATEKEDIDGFAKGGRVGYKNGGGVGTLFKEKRHNG